MNEVRSSRSDYDFILSEYSILPYFDERETLLSKMNDGYIKRRHLQLDLIVKREIGELVQQNQELFDRIENYKKAEKLNADFLAYLQANGIDYQYWFTMYQFAVKIKKERKQYATENPKTEAA